MNRDELLLQLEHHLETDTPLSPELEAALLQHPDLKAEFEELDEIEEELVSWASSTDTIPENLHQGITEKIDWDIPKSISYKRISIGVVAIAASLAALVIYIMPHEEIKKGTESPLPPSAQMVSIPMPEFNVDQSLENGKMELENSGRALRESAKRIFALPTSLFPKVPVENGDGDADPSTDQSSLFMNQNEVS